MKNYALTQAYTYKKRNICMYAHTHAYTMQETIERKFMQKQKKNIKKKFICNLLTANLRHN